MSKIYEVFDGPVSEIVSAVPPVNGYVTFACVDSPDRRACMEQAVDADMGLYEVKHWLSASSSPYLLQMCRVDGDVTTVSDAAAAFSRAHAASKAGAGPAVIDGWLATFTNVPASAHRTVYGFTLMTKPNFTLAEYVLDAATGSSNIEEYVNKSVGDVLRPLTDMAHAISERLDFWPGGALDAKDVAAYIDAGTGDIKTVVTDWTACVNGRAPFRRVFDPFFRNYKEFLDIVHATV